MCSGCSSVGHGHDLELQEAPGGGRVFCHSTSSSVSNISHSFLGRTLSTYRILNAHGRDIQGSHMLTAVTETLCPGFLVPENP